MVEVESQLNSILAELKESGDVESSLVIRRDGLILASDLPKIESRNISSLVAALLSTSESTSMELKRGAMQELVVESEKGKIVLVSAGKLAVLVSLVKKEGNLGFVLISMERAAKKIENIITS
jgi:predicted regulator of Ras-like GTPase activity (Roadblock/LC7/MglB family)